MTVLVNLHLREARVVARTALVLETSMISSQVLATSLRIFLRAATAQNAELISRRLWKRVLLSQRQDVNAISRLSEPQTAASAKEVALSVEQNLNLVRPAGGEGVFF